MVISRFSIHENCPFVLDKQDYNNILEFLYVAGMEFRAYMSKMVWIAKFVLFDEERSFHFILNTISDLDSYRAKVNGLIEIVVGWLFKCR